MAHAAGKIAQIVKLAFISRVLLVVLALLFDAFTEDYDTSALINTPCLTTSDLHISELTDEDRRRPWAVAIGRSLESLVVWDAVFFVRIAECGYEYEQYHAFFPGLPLLMRLLSSTVLKPLVPIIGWRPTLALAALLISNAAFLLAAVSLYRLSLLVLRDESMAWQAAALFCFNPASVFFSSIYTESLFAALSFSGLCCFLTGATWQAVVLFSLSGAVRSNGILHCGFFLFRVMHLCWQRPVTRQTLLVALTALLRCLLVCSLFLAFQAYGYAHFCTPPHETACVSFQARPWCHSFPPYLYGFVQSHYWQVGFLRYFRLKQVPNFILASPAISLSLAALTAFGRRQPGLFWTLGLRAAPEQREAVMLEGGWGGRGGEGSGAHSGSSENGGVGGRGMKERRGGWGERGGEGRWRGFGTPSMLCFLYYLAFKLVVATLVMHVQVATRFLSVSPALYWYGAHLMQPTECVGKEKYPWRGLIRGVCGVYIVGGSLLFVNFYPFT